MAERIKKKVKNPRQVSAREGMAATVAARESADRVQVMTEDEKRAELERIERDLLPHAPTLEAARSDLLALLQLVGMEFVRRYYPDADYVTLSCSKYPHTEAEQVQAGRSFVYWAQIPIPVPRAEGSVPRG